MGMIVEVNSRISIEIRRESFALIVADSHVDQGPEAGRIEMLYTDLRALKQALMKVDENRPDGTSDRPR